MEYSGFMIALIPDPNTAEGLSLPGGNPEESLHLTLGYVSDDDDKLTQVQVAQVIAGMAEVATYSPPVTAKISGIGRFEGCDKDDDGVEHDAIVALIDSPQLMQMYHRVCEIFERYGVDRSKKHGFTPHITLTYVAHGDPSPIDVIPEGLDEVKFEFITLRAGDDEVVVELKGTDMTRDLAPSPYYESLTESISGPVEWRDNLGGLLESTAVGEKAGNKWRVLLIKAGTSGNRIHYSENVLKQAAPLFEGVKAYADHPSKFESNNRPERSVRDVVGWYSNVEWDSGQRGLTADFHVLESADWLRKGLLSSWSGGNPTLFGFSINAAGRKSGRLQEGGALLESIDHVRSTDVVTTPGAGGRVLDVLEAATTDSLLVATLAGVKQDILESVHWLIAVDQAAKSIPDLSSIRAAARAAGSRIRG